MITLAETLIILDIAKTSLFSIIRPFLSCFLSFYWRVLETPSTRSCVLPSKLVAANNLLMRNCTDLFG